ncbi:MAG: diacylglycerol kinase family lipid kinase [Ruminococcaceae bacterium]|nr:diacylglycerol kinase family lipid kinase [Oscillospiraceae bacterium]
MKHIFVINPAAGQGKVLDFIRPKIEEVCKKYSLNCEIHVTERAGEGIEYVRNKAASGEEIRFYACGGDGTLYDVVNGAFGYKNAQVAVIPLGSGNDFIRLFGTKEEFLNLDDQINGVPVEFDVIKCDDEIAINQCSMGMDAEVCAMQGKIKKLPLVTGEGAYYIGCLYAIIRKFKNKFTYSIDGGEKKTKDCLFCFCGNSRWYGGGFMAAPLALPEDGLLDFVIVESRVSRPKLVTLLNKYKRGEHLDWDITEFTRGKKLVIHSDKPAAVNVDGEIKYVTDTSFEIIEKGITYVVPAKSKFLAEREKRLANK